MKQPALGVLWWAFVARHFDQVFLLHPVPTLDKGSIEQLASCRTVKMTALIRQTNVGETGVYRNSRARPLRAGNQSSRRKVDPGTSGLCRSTWFRRWRRRNPRDRRTISLSERNVHYWHTDDNSTRVLKQDVIERIRCTLR